MLPEETDSPPTTIEDNVVPWEELSTLIEHQRSSELITFLENLSPSETARAISRLEEEEQHALFALLAPEDAADVIEDLSDIQAAELLDDIPHERAADIIEELASDQLADVLGEMADEPRQAIIAEMEDEEASEARKLLAYSTDCAGGLMISEYLAFNSEQTIQEVLDDLQHNREIYSDFNVQYFYITDHHGKLTGVLRMHDLLFPDRKTKLADIMLVNPFRVTDNTSVSGLHEFFEEHPLFGVPVVDEEERLLGVVLPEAVEEAVSKKETGKFLRISGIIGGEEFRTMPLYLRSGRRLSWLSMNIVLNIMAASVIAIYQDTLASVIALAVFLPMVSDMSGCSGNQAVAVSMRELSLGLVKPHELFWVLMKEAKTGIINGLVLGSLLGGVAFFWQGNPWLGLVVGAALALNTLLSVMLGGMLPLLLKRLKMDPALVSSPLLTTITDMCGFFFVLSFASMLLPKLIGG